MKKHDSKTTKYFLGTYPEKDWPRIFTVFAVVLIGVIFMGVSMYFSYLNTTPTQDINTKSSSQATSSTDVIFEIYQAKEIKYEGLKKTISGELMVPDPSL